MKKFLVATISALVLVTAGCNSIDSQSVTQAVNGAQDAVTYSTSAITYVNQANDFFTSITNGEVTVDNLSDKVTEMEKNIETFEQLTPPSALEGLHQNLIQQNQVVKKGLELIEVGIETKNLTEDVAKNIANDALTTITSMDKLLPPAK